MKTRQYCYFALKSDVLSAADMTTRLGMEPDEVRVMGTRLSEHRVRRYHSWKVVHFGTESVDDQIQQLVDRLSPVRAGLVSLGNSADVSAVMQVVRYFHDPDGVRAAPDGTLWNDMHGRPRPLGWHLSLPILDFLLSTGAELDVDEYDSSDDASSTATW